MVEYWPCHCHSGSPLYAGAGRFTELVSALASAGFADDPRVRASVIADRWIVALMERFGKQAPPALMSVASKAAISNKLTDLRKAARGGDEGDSAAMVWCLILSAFWSFWPDTLRWRRCWWG